MFKCRVEIIHEPWNLWLFQHLQSRNHPTWTPVSVRRPEVLVEALEKKHSRFEFAVLEKHCLIIPHTKEPSEEDLRSRSVDLCESVTKGSPKAVTCPCVHSMCPEILMRWRKILECVLAKNFQKSLAHVNIFVHKPRITWDNDRVCGGHHGGSHSCLKDPMLHVGSLEKRTWTLHRTKGKIFYGQMKPKLSC